MRMSIGSSMVAGSMWSWLGSLLEYGENRRAVSAGLSVSPVASPMLPMPASVSAATMYSAVSLYSVKTRTFSPGCWLVSMSTRALILESRVESQFPNRSSMFVMVSLSLVRSLRSVDLNTVELTHLVLAGRDFTNVV